MTPTDSDAAWKQIKRRAQRRWGVTPPGESDEPNWSELADHVRDRAVRVGGQLFDAFCEVAKEATATVAEATELLDSDTSKVRGRVQKAGGKAKEAVESTVDSARDSIESLIGEFRDGIAEGFEKSRDRGDTKTLAEGFGMTAGAIADLLLGRSKK